ncbi:hypothetical protein GCM10022419_074450 [Nonomuraea rosea]|uniref:Uncharacterized protein n=1 Tax=Nonomuraea rosea TaxID=638574 RepID=A0ABP6YEM1_9ACTN
MIDLMGRGSAPARELSPPAPLLRSWRVSMDLAPKQFGDPRNRPSGRAVFLSSGVAASVLRPFDLTSLTRGLCGGR